MNYDYLPPIHRPDGERPLHDDFIYPLNKLPRTVDAKPLAGTPYRIAGNSTFWVKNSYPYEERISDVCPGPEWSPKPLGKKDLSHGWQLTIVPTKLFGISVPLPYFQLTTKNNYTFMFGLARLSDDYSDEEKKTYWYSKLFAFEIGRL